MQIPGLLVEYLISGSFAMIWLLPLLLLTGYTPQKDDAAILIVFLPALYVVGMIIDFISGFIVKPHKYRIKKRVYEGFKLKSMSEQVTEIKLLLHAPELAKSSEMRSSRDRIARGTITNAFLITVVAVAYTQQFGITAAVTSASIGLIAVIICWRMWVRFQTLSYRYQIRAIDILDEKMISDNQNSK
jgi:hypothetical protein